MTLPLAGIETLPGSSKYSDSLLKIVEVRFDLAPVDLLKLADPSTEHRAKYLPDSTVFVGYENEGSEVVAVVKKRNDELEVLNLAVSTRSQRRGIGGRMISHVIAFGRSAGVKRVTVGTGNSSLGPLAFYQRRGFRITGFIPNFFETYDPPIVEHGLRCLDLIQLSFDIAPAPTVSSRNADLE